MKNTIRSISLVLILLSISFLCACATAEDVKAINDSLAAQQEFLIAQRQTAVAEKEAAIAAGDAKAVDATTKTIINIDKTLPLIVKAQNGLTASINPDGSVNATGAAAAAAAFIPPPYGQIAGLGVIIAAGVAQEWRRRQAVDAAKSIVNSIDALRATDPKVADAMKTHQKVIQDQLTPLASEIVKNERLGV